MVTEEFINVIRQRIAFGQSAEDIRNALISEHTDEDIYLAYRAAEVADAKALRRIRVRSNRHGLAENPIGLQVRMQHEGRTLLGDVRYYSVHDTTVRLTVTHFNGEPWPLEPLAETVEVLG